jgi:hypothetical protein
MRRYHASKPLARDLVPVKTSRVLFDATQRRRPQPYFAQGVRPRFVPYYAAQASIEDERWWAVQSRRVVEQEWDSDTVLDVRAAEWAAVQACERLGRGMLV